MVLQMLSEIEAKKKSPGFMFAMRKQPLLQPLAKDCYSMKLDLLTNAAVVDDAIRFVSSKTTESSNSNGDDKKSNEPDYEEGEDLLEEPKEEKETGEAVLTTNAVF